MQLTVTMSGLFGTTASSAATSTVGDLKSDVALSDPPTDSISALSFSPAPNGPDFLAVASWDNKVRIYEIAQNGQSQGRHAYEHTQPVFDCDFAKVKKQCIPWAGLAPRGFLLPILPFSMYANSLCG